MLCGTDGEKRELAVTNNDNPVRTAATRLLDVLDRVGDDVLAAEGEIEAIMKELLVVEWLDDVNATPAGDDTDDEVATGWLYQDGDLRIVRGRMRAGFSQEPHDHGAWNIFAVYRGACHYRAYRRLDDGSRPYRADLDVATDRVMTDGDVTVLPGPPHDIHAVTALAPRTTTLLVARGPFSPVRHQYLPELGAFRELPACKAAR
jgi:predicted metal-dependent enzyme (double-stranded beta helix superfamily)